MRSKFNFILRYINKFGNYPIHFSIGFVYYYLFGSLQKKIKYDVFRLPHYAFGIYEATKRAKQLNINKITVIEFGVANGRGLLAMVKYAALIMEKENIEIRIIGFDSGEGMPKHEGYKDHPELYVQGDFPMQDPTNLQKLLPQNAQLIIANLNSEDWTEFLKNDAPIGFISIDVDYYSSTKNLLKHLNSTDVKKLLPNILVYVDDMNLDNHNSFQGELLAINEFNDFSELRKFESYTTKIKQKQKFFNEAWLTQIFQLHVLDHPARNKTYRAETDNVNVIGNKYLNLKTRYGQN